MNNISESKNLYGEITLSTCNLPAYCGESAGRAGQRTGDIFENAVGGVAQDVLSRFGSATNNYILEKSPKYTDHYNRPNKKKDFAIKQYPKFIYDSSIKRSANDFTMLDEWQLQKPYVATNTIMIEVKQMGNCGSHVQKLDYDWANLRAGCYGDNFWLVYDYDRTSNAAFTTINYLKKFCLNLKKEVALIGIQFEFVDFSNLQNIILKSLASVNKMQNSAELS